jgi:hypothetical protein
MRPSIMSDGATTSAPACGVAQRLLGQRLEGLVVHHVAARVGGVDQAVLAVAGVGIERHVGDHAQLGEARLQRLHGARHQALGIPGLLGAGRLAGAVDHREQRQRRHAQAQASSATRSSRSIDTRSTPGIEARPRCGRCRRARTPDRSGRSR